MSTYTVSELNLSEGNKDSLSGRVVQVGVINRLILIKGVITIAYKVGIPMA